MCVDSAVCASDTKGCAVQKEERGKKVDMCSQPVVNIGLPRLRCLVVFASEDESSPLLNTNAQSHMPDGFSRAREGNGDSVGFFGSSVGSVSAHIDHSANSWQGVFFWSFFWNCIYTQSHSHTVMNEQREAKIKGDVITVLCSLGWGYLKECSSQSNTCHMWRFFTLNHCIIATGRYRGNVIFGAPRIGKDTSLCCKPVLMT